jgi:16S rRNA (guanine966-N2)-methyltransferase
LKVPVKTVREAPNRLRIIGGEWRGRRFAFPDVPGIRPSPDRVRETLFNWLQPVLPGSRCLDLFAGSGAVGLEALSRGSAFAVFVDSDARAVAAIAAHLALLGASNRAQCIQADAKAYLQGEPPGPFDLVFLDPPFRQGLVRVCCDALASGGWLAPNAMVYIEMEAEAGEAPLPAGWRMRRSKRAGQVGYHLAETG